MAFNASAVSAYLCLLCHSADFYQDSVCSADYKTNYSSVCKNHECLGRNTGQNRAKLFSVNNKDNAILENKRGLQENNS